MKITTIEQYKEIEPYLTTKLGLDDEETVELLAEGEGPEIGITDSGQVWGIFSDCINCSDNRAFRGSSAGGVVNRTHSVTAIVRKLINS